MTEWCGGVVVTEWCGGGLENCDLELGIMNIESLMVDGWCNFDNINISIIL